MNLTNFDRWPIHLGSDALARLSVSEPAAVLELKQTFDARPRQYESLVSGGATATYSNNTKSTDLSVSSSGDSAIFQTRRYLNYQTGKSLQNLAGFKFSAHATGLTQRVGYFDANNGAFIQLDDSGLALIVRSGGSTVLTVPRASWMDPMNGIGASAINLNLTSRHALCVSLSGSQWQSFRVGLLIDARWVPIYCGGFANSTISGPLTPNLPMRWETSTTGSAGTLSAGSTACSSEGGRDITGEHRAAWTDVGKSVSAGAIGHIVSVRNKTGQYLRAPTLVTGASLLCSTTGSGQWMVVLNPTLAGTASWVDNGGFVEHDVSRTTMTAGTGIVLHTGFFNSSASHAEGTLRDAYQLCANIAGTTRDEVALVVKNLSVSSDTFYGNINYTEQN